MVRQSCCFHSTCTDCYVVLFSGGESQVGSEDYRGPHPFSESETKTMKMLQKKLNFAKVSSPPSMSHSLNHARR